jgi:hypothetical protein
MIIGKLSVLSWSVFKIAANGTGIAEGGDYEAQVFKIVQMFNRSTTVHFSNTPPLLAICCYVTFFFTNFN